MIKEGDKVFCINNSYINLNQEEKVDLTINKAYEVREQQIDNILN